MMAAGTDAGGTVLHMAAGLALKVLLLALHCFAIDTVTL